MTEEHPAARDPDPDLLDTSSYRLSDKQALALLGGYLVLRTITTRVGFIFLLKLATEVPWAVPLLNNSRLSMITVGTTVHGRPAMIAAVVASSLFLSLVAGLVLYWAGWRFGPELAKRAASGNAAWASVWNPKQVRRAHRWVERWGVFAVFFARGAQILVTPVVLVAGSSRMTLRKYLSAYFAGAVVFAGTTLWLGGRAAVLWPWLPERIKAFADWSVRIGLIATAVLILLFVFSPKRDQQETDASDDGDPSSDVASAGDDAGPTSDVPSPGGDDDRLGG